MPVTPYAGQQARQIKALSDEDIAALRKGEGMGMAKAAELNGYPGPAHVLGLATQLGLHQLQQITAIFERMSAAAKPLGGELIAREQALNQLFATGEITPDRSWPTDAPIAAVSIARRSAVAWRAHFGLGEVALRKRERARAALYCRNPVSTWS